MDAEPLMQERYVLDERSFVEIVVWRVPAPLRGSRHLVKYRLAYVVGGECLLRYDNEAGKGDHRHVEDREEPYGFSSIDGLLADFWADVDARRRT
jgi:hypothetical protein